MTFKYYPLKLINMYWCSATPCEHILVMIIIVVHIRDGELILVFYLVIVSAVLLCEVLSPIIL